MIAILFTLTYCYLLPYALNPDLCNFISTEDRFNGFACRPFKDLIHVHGFNSLTALLLPITRFFSKCTTHYQNMTHGYCDRTIMYQCQKSAKCISKHRILDGFSDCPFNDDEENELSCELKGKFRFRCSNFRDKCVSVIFMYEKHGICDSEFQVDVLSTSNKFSYPFGALCDRIEHEFKDQKGETDETNCEHWPCNIQYTRCDRYWTCDDGSDEVNCPYLP